MAMNGAERSKIVKLIEKIQRGEFDELDVDSIFMKLRPFSGRFKVFREIADFVAHNDVRDRGIVNAAMEGFYYRIKFFNEFTHQKKNLNIFYPFPAWIKKLFLYQVDRIDRTDLWAKYHVHPERLKTRIEKGFELNNKSGLIEIVPAKISGQTQAAIGYVMSFIIGLPVIRQKDIIDELTGVIGDLGFPIDKLEFNKKANRIMASVLVLLHNSQSQIGIREHQTVGVCRVRPERDIVVVETGLDVSGNSKELFLNEFGKLALIGVIPLLPDKNIQVAHHLVSTELDASEWCGSTLFDVRANEHNSLLLEIRYKSLPDIRFGEGGKIEMANL